MFKHFIHNEFLSLTRSYYFKQKMLIKLFVGVLMFTILTNITIFGYYLPNILMENGFLIIEKSTWVLLVYLLFDLLIKLLTQKLPLNNQKCYFLLPINRYIIIGFLILKSIFSIQNIIGLSFWVPFIISIHGIRTYTVILFAFILLFLIMNTQISLIYKSSLYKNSWMILFSTIIVLIGVTEYISLTSFSTLLHSLPKLLIESHFNIIIFVCVFILFINISLFKNLVNLSYDEYLSKFNNKGKKIKVNENKMWNGIIYELKLLWRNKRYRFIYLQSILMLFLIIFQGINISENKSLFNSQLIIFLSLHITIHFSIAFYGQFFFSAESTFFDKYLTIPFDFEKIIKNKLITSIILATIFLIILIPLVFYKTLIFTMLLSSYLYHIGITTYLMLLRGTISNIRFEIHSRALFNFQGSNFTLRFSDMLLLIDIILPIGFFILFYYFGFINLFYYVISLIGISSLLLRKYWNKLLVKNLEDNKYIMSERFRK